MILGNTKPTRRDHGDDNMIPLINIVFLMLIFFMVAGQVSKSDIIKTLPPESINDKRVDENVSINIVASVDGSIYIEDRLVDYSELKSALEMQLSEYANLDALSVRIKADAGLPVDELRALLVQIRAAGLVRVSLITRLSEAGE